MSTVLLLTDAWQPTVLRIVPFSSNNARSDDNLGVVKVPNGARGFPVLAVTRSQNNGSANSGSRSGGKSASSFRSDLHGDSDTYSVASNVSGCTDRAKHDTELSQNIQKRFAQKRIPEMHSEMKEAIKFSVQDINDQVSASSSMPSSDHKEDTKERHSRVDNTRTRLPKPSLSTSPDIRTYYTPVNGVRRSVPLTPGELELQRIRESYYVEQVQRKKRYKLNVNQLPRSTTPISDNDPDKLNMKQVIAFLQTKTGKENATKLANDRKCENGAKSVRYTRKHSELTTFSSPSPKKIFAKDTVHSLSRSNSEARTLDRTDNTRQIPGCISVMSTKSSPSLTYNSKTPSKPGKATSTHSTRSFREKKSDKQKPVKEFKLYRFLAIAPDGQNQGCASTVSDAVPTLEKSIVTEKLRNAETPRPLFTHRNKDRESGAARVLHRHAINRTVNTPPKVEKDTYTRAIRLPLMADPGCDSPDVESESESTSSALNIPTKQSPDKDDSLQKLDKTISFEKPVNTNTAINTLEEVKEPSVADSTDCTLRNDVRTHTTPGFPKVNISVPKQIRINVPNESKKTYSQEIVRLTLRQDKRATRVTSYMSDMESSSPRYNEEKGTEVTVARSTPRSNSDNTDRLTVSSLSQNSFSNRYIYSNNNI